MKAPPGDGYKKVSSLVQLPDFLPGLGTLYVKPDTLPAGPFLAYDRQGRLVSSVYMIPLKDLEAHKTFDDLAVAHAKYDYYCMPHEAAGMVGRLVVGRPGGPGALPFDYFVGRPDRRSGNRCPARLRKPSPALRRSCSNTSSGADKAPMGTSGVALVSPAAMGGAYGTCRQRIPEALSKTQKVATPTLSTVRPRLFVGGGTQSIVRQMP
jgi:hypothetical protein